MMLINHSQLWLTLIFYFIVWIEGNKDKNYYDNVKKEFIEIFQSEDARNKVGQWVQKFQNIDVRRDFCEKLGFDTHPNNIMPAIDVHKTNFQIHSILCRHHYVVLSETGFYYTLIKSNYYGTLDIFDRIHEKPFDRFVHEYKNQYLWNLPNLTIEAIKRICKIVLCNFKFSNVRKLNDVENARPMKIAGTNYTINSIKCYEGIHLIKSNTDQYYVFDYNKMDEMLYFRDITYGYYNIVNSTTKKRAYVD